MADKTASPDGDIFADKGVRLDFSLVANPAVALDFDKRTDEHVVTQRAVVKIGGFINDDVVAAYHIADGDLAE